MLRDYQPSDRAAEALDVLCEVLAGIRKYWFLIFAGIVLLWQPLAYIMAYLGN